MNNKIEYDLILSRIKKLGIPDGYKIMGFVGNIAPVNDLERNFKILNGEGGKLEIDCFYG